MISVKYIVKIFNNEHHKIYRLLEEYVDCIIDDKANLPSHIFLTYKESNKIYWFEHLRFDFKGVYEYKNEDEKFRNIKNKFVNSRKKEIEKNYDVYLYEYKKSEYHIICHEFYEYIKKKKILQQIG